MDRLALLGLGCLAAAGCDQVFDLRGRDAPGPPADSPLSRYAQTVLADRPLAYWRLSDSLPTAEDATGAGNVGLYRGGVTQQVPGAIVDDADSAATFNALTGDDTGDFVDVGDRLSFEGTAPFSLELWANPRTLDGTFTGVVCKTDESSGGNIRVGYHLYSQDAKLGFERRDAIVGQDVRTGGLELNRWTHVVVTFDGVALQLFVDGTLQATTGAPTPSLPPTTRPFVLGARSGGDYQFFEGSLDEVAVYDHALAQEQIDRHRAVGLGQ